MNTITEKGWSVEDSQQHTFQTVVSPSALMVDNECLAESTEEADVAAHRNARQLVQFLQCCSCSKPFTAPVTLPCGHTLCQRCLPEPRPRTNISYPNTLDHQLGVICPVPDCNREHSSVECSVDVTFNNLVALVEAEISNHQTMHPNSPLTLLEVLPEKGHLAQDEVQSSAMGRIGQFHGGRLASTFEMADLGLLHHSADVVYRSTTGDDYQALDTTLVNRLREVFSQEMDCLVCYNMMLDPTTTSCGHTFCRRCLTRVLDHSDICPVCRRDLHIPASLQNQPHNRQLTGILDQLCPDLLAARRSALEEEERPGEDARDTPLFICTLSFPAMPTFLHIFEPRYRLMVRRCLEENKRFGMVMYNRTATPQGDLGPTRFLEYGTLLEIVSVQLMRDGRSLVETRGLSRFRVKDFGMLDGYDIGRVERVEDVSLNDEKNLEEQELQAAQEAAAQFNSRNPEVPRTPDNFPHLLSTQELMDRCTNFIEEMREHSAPWLSTRIVSVYGEPPRDPALFPYWFAAVLPIADEEKYLLLKTTSVRERLKIVHDWITRIQRQSWYVTSSDFLYSVLIPT
jgi:Lon protease-like protein